MLLPALGLHGLLLAYPIQTKGDLEAALPKPGKPVRVITLPSMPPSSEIKKIAARQPVNLSSKVQSTSLLQPKRVVVQKIAAAPPKTVTAVSQPKSLVSKPQPSPTPSATPTPISTPANEFQMEGAAAGCTASPTQDCFAFIESDGRLVARRIEENLNKKGYDLSPLDLAEENGIKVYQLSKRGQSKQGQPDYLHVFWDENGTVYFRNPTVLSYAELAAKAR
jgi:hypothetical protein